MSASYSVWDRTLATFETFNCPVIFVAGMSGMRAMPNVPSLILLALRFGMSAAVSDTASATLPSVPPPVRPLPATIAVIVPSPPLSDGGSTSVRHCEPL